MNKAIVIIIFILIPILLIGAILFKDVIAAMVLEESVGKEYIALANGTFIEADRAWESGGIYFYEIEGESYLLNKDEVKNIGKIDYKYHFAQVKNRASNLANQMLTPIKKATGSTVTSMNRNFLIVVFILGAALVCIFFLIIVRGFVGNLKTIRPNKEQVCTIKKCDGNSEITRMDIVRHFLELFRLQIGAPADAPAKIAPLSSKSSGPNYIYELRVNDRGEWVKRRMSIGPLGEDTGSKSKCYYVIYDVHLVVKIPTKPIHDFEKYIASINKEGRIAEKLAPKECVIPKASVILNLIHKLPGMEQIPAEALEEKYINWLRRKPHFQEYLKIKNSFIYFMDFSKFYFLGHIIDNLHDLKDAIPGEIIENSETVWETAKFKGRYGKENESVAYEIREVYDKYELEIHKLILNSKVLSSVPLYQKQNWFLSHLIGKQITQEESRLPEDLVKKLNHLIKAIFGASKKSIESYRKTIKEYVFKIRLEQDRPKMSGIITNLIDLLAWQREKHVALRDLKPDNLLVAGDPAKYPRFLMSADDYSLGIIDVETAVDFEKSKYKKTKQPLLGGTPFYATPSHFFKNETLELCFHNYRKVLHFQDWHAMVVMIFKVVTGDLLFEQTARLFGHIKERIKASYADVEGQVEVVKEVSQMFWRSAAIEFQLKINEKENALKTTLVSVPDNAGRLFMGFLKKDQKHTKKQIHNLINAQPTFKSNKSRELLFKSSPSQIIQFKKHLQNKFKKASPQEFDSEQVLEFTDNLFQLKIHADRQKQVIALLSREQPRITAYDLISFMFYTVYHVMLREDWQVVKRKKVSVTRTLDDEATTLEVGDC
jgi:hypothetical protein